jgi:4-coumarate--CoA ligase
MLGYIGSRELTEAAMTENGFLRTGDIGWVDKAGFVFLVDRAKEMIKVKG